MADEDPTTVRAARGVASLAGLAPFIEFSGGPRQGERLPLRPGSWIVGKGDDADFKMDASGVSRHHATIEVGDDGTVTVTDLGSTNGTFVGDRRITSSAVGRGDRLCFGPDAIVRLVYLEAGAPKRAETLSARQLQLARLVASGMSNAQVAEQLGISRRTVTSHLDHIYARLDIRSRTALTRWVLERGLDD
ncbi:MAG: LuxR C-terminal-related transcriptional regulator [Myxococcota bacterium]